MMECEQPALGNGLIGTVVGGDMPAVFGPPAPAGWFLQIWGMQ